MKTRLVRIGNSRGIRFPKPLIEQAGLADEVELQVRRGAIVVRAVDRPRAGWAEAAATLGATGSCLLDGLTRTRFDGEDWSW